MQKDDIDKENLKLIIDNNYQTLREMMSVIVKLTMSRDILYEENKKLELQYQTMGNYIKEAGE